MSRFTLAVLFVKTLCLCANVFGDDVHIAVRTGQKCNGWQCTTAYAYGSGVTIGKLRDGREAVLTCAHVVQGAERITISWYDEARVEAQVLLTAYSDGMDVALLAANLPNVRACNPLMEAPPAVDQSIVVKGYPGGQGCVKVRGSLFGRALVVRAYDIKQGMSGGAVYAGDKLAGIVSGYEVQQPQNGVYTASWLIVPWLKQRLGYVPECCESPSEIATKPTPEPSVAPPPPTDRPPADLLARIERLEKALAGLASPPSGLQGPRGPAGVQGPQGPMGPQGPAGSIDAESIDTLREEIAALKSERLKVQLHAADKDGKSKLLTEGTSSNGVVKLTVPPLDVKVKSDGALVDEDQYPITGPVVLEFTTIKAKSK